MGIDIERETLGLAGEYCWRSPSAPVIAWRRGRKGRADLAKRPGRAGSATRTTCSTWDTVQRDDHLMPTASGALHERSWPPVSDDHRPMSLVIPCRRLWCHRWASRPKGWDNAVPAVGQVGAFGR